MCCTVESTLPSKIILEQAFPQKQISPHANTSPRTLSAIVVKGSLEQKKVHVTDVVIFARTTVTK